MVFGTRDLDVGYLDPLGAKVALLFPPSARCLMRPEKEALHLQETGRGLAVSKGPKEKSNSPFLRPRLFHKAPTRYEVLIWFRHLGSGTGSP